MSATGTTTTPSPEPGEGLGLVMPGRVVDAGAGWRWVAQGWRLFRAAPFLWIACVVALFLVMVAMSLVPVIGGAAFQVLQTVFWAGCFAACRSVELHGEFEPGDLVAGFRRGFVPLVIIAVIYFACGLAIAVIWVAIVGLQTLYTALGAMAVAVQSGDVSLLMELAVGLFRALALGTLVALALLMPLLASVWFSPALVLMHGMKPVAAMKASLVASLRNFVPFLVYSLVMTVFAVAIPFTLGLALLVYVPLFITSAYASYRDVFTQDAALTPPGRAAAPA